jgi:hypothetical protein
LCSWCVIVFSYGSFDVKIVQEGFEKIVGLDVNVCVRACVCVGLIWVMNNMKNYNLGSLQVLCHVFNWFKGKNILVNIQRHFVNSKVRTWMLKMCEQRCSMHLGGHATTKKGNNFSS